MMLQCDRNRIFGTVKKVTRTLEKELSCLMLCRCQLKLSEGDRISSLVFCVENMNMDHYLVQFVIKCWSSGEFKIPPELNP